MSNLCWTHISILECSTPNMNGLFSRSTRVLKWNLIITLFESRLGFFCQTKTNMEHIDPIRHEQLNSRPVQSVSISLSIVHIVSDPKIDPVLCEHSLMYQSIPSITIPQANFGKSAKSEAPWQIF